MVEIDRVARMPLAVSIVEFELHKVAGDRGEEHAARDGAVGGGDGDGVVELENLVVAGTAIPDLEAAVPGQDPRHRLRHRRLLRDVEDAAGGEAGAGHGPPPVIEGT